MLTTSVKRVDVCIGAELISPAKEKWCVESFQTYVMGKGSSLMNLFNEDDAGLITLEILSNEEENADEMRPAHKELPICWLFLDK